MSPSSTVLSSGVETLDTMAWRTRGSNSRLAMAAATRMTSAASPAAMRRRRGEKSTDVDVAREWVEPNTRPRRNVRRSWGSHDASAAQQPNQKQHGRDNQQDVDERADRIAAHEPEQP